MQITITQIIYLVCFIQVFIFSIFLIRNIHRCSSNCYLSIFFIAQLVILGRQLAGLFLDPKMQHLFDVLTFPTFWFVVPSVLLYTQSTLNTEYRINKITLLHFIPSLLVLIYNSTYGLQSYLVQQGFSPLITEEINKIVEIVLVLSMYIYFLIYTIWSLIIIRFYRYGTDNNKVHRKQKVLIWLRVFVSSFFISWMVNAVIIYALNLHILAWNNSTTPILLIIPFFVFFNIVFYYAWENPRIFISKDEKLKNSSDESEHNKIKKYVDEITNHMKINKPYLDPELTMNRLSEQLNIPIRDLSKSINQRFQQNFNDFINFYRIKEVTGILSTTDKLDTDLVSLALDCGFNSKASFFRVFKKNTGLTPRQFYDNIQLKKQEVLSEAC